MIELGSSWAAEFTVSLAPITRVRSVSDWTHHKYKNKKTCPGGTESMFLRLYKFAYVSMTLYLIQSFVYQLTAYFVTHIKPGNNSAINHLSTSTTCQIKCSNVNMLRGDRTTWNRFRVYKKIFRKTVAVYFYKYWFPCYRHTNKK